MCQSLVCLNKSKSLPFNLNILALNDASVSEQSQQVFLRDVAITSVGIFRFDGENQTGDPGNFATIRH